MKLKLISLIPVLLGLFVFFGLSFLMQNYIIKPTFSELQKNRAYEDASRVTEAIQREFYHLGNLTSDWAEWDDTYNFVQGKNPSFISTNIDWISLERGAKVNLINVYDKNGSLYFSSAFDSELGGEIYIKELSSINEKVKKIVISCINNETPEKGFLQTNNGLMMISIHPLLTTQSTGPVQGALIMGRFFNNSLMESIKDQVKVNCDFMFLNQSSFNFQEESLLKKLKPGEKKYLENKKTQQEFVYESQNDLSKSAIFLIKTPVRADIKETGLSTGRSVIVWLGIAAIISLIFVSILNFKIRDKMGKSIGYQKNKAFQIAFTAFIIIMIGTYLLYYELKNLRIKDSEVSFNSKASIQKNIIENGLKETISSMVFVKNFFEGSNFVSNDEFDNFTTNVLKNDLIKNIFWVEYKAPKIKSNQQFFAQSDYQLPLIYSNPPTNQIEKSYDFSSDRTINPIILKACDISFPLVYEDVTLLNKNKNEYLLFIPVYNIKNVITLDEKRNSFKGVLIAVIDINKVFSSALTAYSLNDLAITVYDVTTSKSPIELFSNKNSSIDISKFWKTRLTQTKTINFAGRIWQFEIEPDALYYQKLVKQNYFILFPIGFFIALLLALYLYNINTYRLQAEILVKQKTAELQESEELYRTLIELSPDSVFLVDLSGNIQTVNKKGKELLGFSQNDQILKHNFKSFIDNENLLTYEIYVEETINHRSTEMFELLLNRADHSQIPIEIGIAVWIDSQNRVKALIYTIRDISQRLNAEIERLELERKMLHTQKLESLGVMAGGIAHDFNNLLMAIIGNLDIVRPLISDNPPLSDKINKALSASKRAVDLTKQMLAYSGKGQFVIKAVNLSQLMKDNSEILKAAINKNVVFEVDLSDNIPSTKADIGQCQQIIMNLITNASEAIGDNSGKLILRTGVMSCDENYLSKSKLEIKCYPGKYVWIEVTDNGCGMDIYTMNRMFEPFYTTKFTGRGLGMSAVLGIVKAHKGAVIIDSEPGVGTVIRILFPAMTDEEEKEYIDSKPEEEPIDKKLIAEGYVLVVDDEDMVREICKDMLTILGYKVLVASDAEEAVQVYKEYPHQIMCVLMDLMMPGKDVVEGFNEIIEFDNNAKIILSSGYNEYEAMKQFNQKGLSGFIEKPYQLAKLKKIFLQLFSN